MGKSVLFIGFDTPTEEEIREYLDRDDSSQYFAQTPEQAIHLLGDHCIGKVVLNLVSIRDAVVLRYINRYHTGVEVVVSVNQELNDLLSAFTQGSFSKLPRPFRLEELKTVI